MGVINIVKPFESVYKLKNDVVSGYFVYWNRTRFKQTSQGRPHMIVFVFERTSELLFCLGKTLSREILLFQSCKNLFVSSSELLLIFTSTYQRHSMARQLKWLILGLWLTVMQVAKTKCKRFCTPYLINFFGSLRSILWLIFI